MSGLRTIIKGTGLGIMLSFSALCPVSIYGSVTHRAYDGTEWKRTTTFDNMPRKIVDTPWATFFFVHQHYYRKNADIGIYLSNPHGGLYIYDKNNPEAGIQDLQHLASLSRADVDAVAYSAKGDYLVICYKNGLIDLLDSNMEVHSINALVNQTYPGMLGITGITVDKDYADAWVTTKAGFVRIDGEKKCLKEIAVWGKPVNGIMHMGDRYVAIIDGTFHTAPASDSAVTLSKYSVMSGWPANCAKLMPLDENNFGFISGSSILSGTFSEDAAPTYKTLVAVTPAELYNADIYTQVSDIYESNVSVTNRGYLILGYELGVQLTVENGTPQLIYAPHYENPGYYGGSWDFKNFWFYRNRGSFANVELNVVDGAFVWSDDKQVLSPKAPLNCMETHFLNSDRHGFIAVNGQHHNHASLKRARFQPVLISKFNGNDWENLSPAYHAPRFTESSDTYKNLYNTYKERYPTSDPIMATIDPNYPDMIHMGSESDGFVSLSLADIGRDPYIMSNYAAPWNTLPAFRDVPAQSWGNCTNMQFLGADANGVLWVLHGNGFLTPEPNPKKWHFELWGWTPEARRSHMENGGVQGAKPWIKIKYDADLWPNARFGGLALKHPNNKNKFLAYCESYPGIVVYDHNGTISEDTSDDTFDMIKRVRMPSGIIVDAAGCPEFAEDPVTGKCYMYKAEKLLEVDLRNPVVDGVIDGRALSNNDEKGSESGIGMANIGAFGIAFDDYNRMWVASADNGLVCFDADRKKILHHYTSENSPLDGSMIFSVGWNKTNKSVYVSTHSGILEFKPDAIQTADALSTEDIYVMPAKVEPSFGGNVVIYNMPQNAFPVVMDTKGNVVAQIKNSGDGICVFDLHDINGKRLESGRYIITDKERVMGKSLELLVTK